MSKLQKQKWFEKVLQKIEDTLVEDQAEKKELRKTIKQKDDAYDKLESDIVEERRKQKLQNHELSRYNLDDDDEYLIDLKSRRLKDPENSIIKDKERDEYLRRIADLDPEFDMFEYRNKVLNKRSQ